MKIALDIRPLGDPSHNVRGIGSYLESLKVSLLKYFPNNQYTFFTRGEKIPKDINLMHIPYFDPFFITIPIKKRYPLVVTVHDLIPFVFPDQFPRGIKGSIKWLIQRNSLKKADAIITDSESSKHDIARFVKYPLDKIRVVYLAPDERYHAIEKKKKLVDEIKQKFSLPDKFVLYVGDATWNKNLPRLVHAIKALNVPLVLVGKTLNSTSFDRHNPWNKDLVIVNNLIDSNPLFLKLGFVSQEDLVTLYNAATLFAMPSLYEGFGLPILEAMKCGCPVVTAQNSSITEIAGDAAYFVNANDSADIVHGIKEVFSSKKLQDTLSRKGIIQAEKFSWKKTAQQTVEVYENALQS